MKAMEYLDYQTSPELQNFTGIWRYKHHDRPVQTDYHGKNLDIFCSYYVSRHGIVGIRVHRPWGIYFEFVLDGYTYSAFTRKFYSYRFMKTLAKRFVAFVTQLETD
jgi:hypothetical protein